MSIDEGGMNGLRIHAGAVAEAHSPSVPRVDRLCDAVADRLRTLATDPPTGSTVVVEAADVPVGDPNELADGVSHVWVSWEVTPPDHVTGRKEFMLGVTLMERHPSGRLPPLDWRRERTAWFDALVGRLASERPLGMKVQPVESLSLIKDELRSGVVWLASNVVIGDTAPLHRPIPRGG